MRKITKNFKKRLPIIWVALFSILASGGYLFFTKLDPIEETIGVVKSLKPAIEENIGLVIKADDEFWSDKAFSQNDENYLMSFTIKAELQNHLKNIILRHKSDYVSIVVLDNNNGEILAALDYNRENNQFGKKVTFSSTSPAASLFKVVTAASLMEYENITPDSVFQYSGRATTLYRHQIEGKANKRWVIDQTLENAFARSNNVVFGTAAVKHLNPEQLFNMAQSFGFNKQLLEDYKMGKSFFPIAKDDYNLAELASGLNTATLISPIHAAKIPLIVVNNGKNLPLRLISSIKDSQGKEMYKFPSHPKDYDSIISAHTADEIKTMMREAMRSGTARSVTRKLPNKIRDALDFGGKTGSMTGGVPFGRRDWLVSFVKPKDSQDRGISIAVMIVNKSKWFVKSSELTKEIIKYYYEAMLTQDDIHHVYSSPKRKRHKK